MAWEIEGHYFENCSCDVPCPCTVSLDLGADYDRCQVLPVFHVDSGEVEGNWRLGMLSDDAASDEQAQKLGAVFGGQLGGPMEALGPLVGEMLGSERVPIEVSCEGGTHRVKIGDDTEVEVRDVVSWGKEDGEPARLTGIFQPAGDTLTVSKAGTSQVKAFGLDFSNAGKSGFSSRFAWSA